MSNSILITRVNLNPIAIALVVLILFFCPVFADIKSIKLYNDSRQRIHVKDFCFSKTGHVSISLKSLSTTGGAPFKNTSRLGFFMWRYSIWYKAEDIEDCLLDIPEDILTLSNPNHTILIKMGSWRYNIYFANCAPPGTPINLELELETYNLDKDGKKSYLQYLDTYLPSVLFVFSSTYVVIICFWVHHCYRNKPYLHKIHVLMTTLLVVKCVTIFIAAGEKHHIKVTGRPQGWKIWLYVFHVILTVHFWTVLMLIGTGWSYMRPLLQRRDKIMLGIGVAIQVILNIFYIFLDETERFRESYMYWFYAFMVIDLASFVVAAVPTIWFLMSLKELANENDPEALRSLQRMRLIGNIVLVVYCYGLGTRLWPWLIYQNDDYFCFIETSIAVYSEVCSAVVYGVLFYLLRPMEENQYYACVDEEIPLETIEREST